jgi:hypothetical protein
MRPSTHRVEEPWATTGPNSIPAPKGEKLMDRGIVDNYKMKRSGEKFPLPPWKLNRNL